MVPPSEQAMRHWKKAVGGLSEEAFEAIQEVSQSLEAGIDASAVSQSILLKPSFIDLKTNPRQQALVVHTIARRVQTDLPEIACPSKC